MAKWIEVLSHDKVTLEKLGADYMVHPLALEDCFNRDQKPKLDDYVTHQFLVWFMYHKSKVYEIQFIIFPDKLIAVPHEQPPEGLIWSEFLKLGSNYRDVWHMLYTALDKITDVTWLEVRSLYLHVDEIEQQMFKKDINPQSLLKLKKRLNSFDYTLGHLSSVVVQLRNLIKPTGDLNWKLRDLSDHCDRIYANVTLYRSQISTTIELFWGLQANRTNRQIKKLSLLASISVPITFWASFWGMNFQIIPFDKPELFYAAIGIMVLSVSLTMYLLVRKGYWD